MEEANFDPVKAERYQDGMIKAREKMQRDLEEKAREYQEEKEEARECSITIMDALFLWKFKRPLSDSFLFNAHSILCTYKPALRTII